MGTEAEYYENHVKTLEEGCGACYENMEQVYDAQAVEAEWEAENAWLRHAECGGIEYYEFW